MALTRTVSHASLRNHAALPTIREICASPSTEFRVTDLPEYVFSALLGRSEGEQSVRINKKEIKDSAAPISSSIVVLAKALHALSADIFNEISHALELPWEKYLSEMHEFEAEGNDELRLYRGSDAIEREFSSLILVFDLSRPRECLVVFGEALRTFSENTIAVGDEQARIEVDGPEATDGDRVAYYVRPNADVFYTRAAGALMTPLSHQEHLDRKTIKELLVQV